MTSRDQQSQEFYAARDKRTAQYGAKESALTGEHDLSGKVASWTLTSEVEACSRGGSGVSLCGYVAPQLYALGWLTGIHFVIRLAYDKTR